MPNSVITRWWAKCCTPKLQKSYCFIRGYPILCLRGRGALGGSPFGHLPQLADTSSSLSSLSPSLSLPIHRLKLRDRRADGFLLTERLWAFLHTDRLTELRGKGGFLHHALIHDLEQGLHCVSVTSSLG